MDVDVSPQYFLSKRMTNILGIVAMVCFISFLVSCAPGCSAEETAGDE